MNIGLDYHYSPCIDSEASVIDYTSHRQTVLLSDDNPELSNQFNIHDVRDHPLSQVIGDPTTRVRTRCQVSSNICMIVNFVSLIEPKKVNDALNDPNYPREMQDELH